MSDKKYFGAHESYEYYVEDGEFCGDDDKLFEILMGHNRVYYEQKEGDPKDKSSLKTKAFSYILNDFVSKRVSKDKKFKFYKRQLTQMLQSIRCIKSESEIVLLSQSAQIASLSMIEAMQFCKSGMIESELAVLFEANCKMRGAKQLSFECSVASGSNAANLSYFNNSSLLKDGSLCLIDCGCEFLGYSSDITRTFPINGRFTDEQRKLYELVLSVQTKLISAMRPESASIKKLETMTRRFLKKGLDELGITRNLSKQQITNLKVMSSDVHYVAHIVGLDIHDTSDIAMSRPFEPNMVLAIEPAVYLPDHPLIPPKFRNIGVRIEDNVLITDSDAVILSNALPRTCEQIEALMAEQSQFSRIRPFNLRNVGNDDNRN